MRARTWNLSDLPLDRVCSEVSLRGETGVDQSAR